MHDTISKKGIQLKPQQDATTQQLEWLKLGTLGITSIEEDRGWLELPETAAMSGKWYKHIGKELDSFFKS